MAIPELRALAEGKRWLVDQPIAELATLTPVRGEMAAVHQGSALEVSAAVETILTLSCARCLQQFNQALRVDVRELIEFRDAPSPGAGQASALGDDLEDRLDPQGRFDPERWLFEQLSLRLPMVNRCGDDCPGPPGWTSAPRPADPRWAALQALRPAMSAADQAPASSPLS
ncbi:MAG: hypothetical protein RLZZ117_263 [Cyanobacteriota bacterium]|jgi:uncharacterized protein